MSWLLDTFVWTAALLALVLVLRGPVARQFGPQAAYALWALPFLRLLLPPVELPAWLAPADPAPAPAATEMTYLVVNADPAAVVPSEAAQSFDWLVLVPAVWLAGAAVFLALRFNAYFRMRRQLLAHARPVGDCGRVRLVETPEVASPLAFGVLDKVVALPMHFMAHYDRLARDLALEHELAHHRGHDLLANFAVQPLFALHWFNPLSWLGWRALRRDQEAACDARVIAARGVGERAAYASLIAEFAAGPRIALAAPMACPVLGDKSIVHRLRSLKMTDISRRRRFAGRVLIGAAALALPLTASITYAEVPAAPAPPEAPLAPAAPAGLAPAAPDAPAPPPAPEAPRSPEEGDGDHQWAEGERRVTVHRIERDGKPVRTERRVYRGDQLVSEDISGDLNHDLAEMREELHRELGENGEMRREIRVAVAEARAGARAAGHAPKVVNSCRDGDRPVTREVDEHGRTTLFVCESAGDRIALKSLQRARESIARNPGIAADVRGEVLASLDREIARLEADK